jgi:hypothetical protein
MMQLQQEKTEFFYAEGRWFGSNRGRHFWRPRGCEGQIRRERCESKGPRASAHVF